MIDRTLTGERRLEVPTPSRLRRLSCVFSGQKVSVALVVAVFFEASMFVLMSSTAPSVARTFHSPIYIMGDDARESSDAVTGSGSIDDPYVISGCEIFSFTGPGISIQGTSAYLVIRDVHINSTADGLLNPAIYLQGVSNVTVEGSLINTTENGIIVTESDNVTVSGMESRDYAGWGVDVSYSEDISVMDSYLTGLNGIRESVVSELIVMSNQVGQVDTGMMLTEVDNATVQDNTFWDCETAMGFSTGDTSFSSDKTSTHTFLIPGNYTIRMEVMDTGGLSNITSETVEVAGTAIPEFTSLVVPVTVVMVLFIVVRRRRQL